MADFPQAFYEYASADAGISGIVGTAIYPGVAPADQALPYCIWNMIGSQHVVHYNGESGLAEYELQVDHYAATYAGVWALADAWREAFSMLRDEAFDASNRIAEFRLERQVDSYLPAGDGAEVGKYRITQVFYVWTGETV